MTDDDGPRCDLHRGVLLPDVLFLHGVRFPQSNMRNTAFTTAVFFAPCILLRARACVVAGLSLLLFVAHPAQHYGLLCMVLNFAGVCTSATWAS